MCKWNCAFKARYTLATKLNSTRSTLLKVDNPYTLATKSTVSATVDFVASVQATGLKLTLT